eukprot:4308555-Amphidinium_carterae.1
MSGSAFCRSSSIHFMQFWHATLQVNGSRFRKSKLSNLYNVLWAQCALPVHGHVPTAMGNACSWGIKSWRLGWYPLVLHDTGLSLWAMLAHWSCDMPHFAAPAHRKAVLYVGHLYKCCKCWLYQEPAKHMRIQRSDPNPFRNKISADSACCAFLWHFMNLALRLGCWHPPCVRSVPNYSLGLPSACCPAQNDQPYA